MRRRRLGIAVSACTFAAVAAASVFATAIRPAAGSGDSRSHPLLRQDPRPVVGEPGPIAGQDYKRVFHDDFDKLDQCASGCRWSRRLWHKGLPPRKSHYVKGSALHLVSRRSQGFPKLAVTTLSDKGTKGRAFRYGYFEARMRWTGGNGAWPAFWLLSRANVLGRNGPDLLTAELDVFEGYGWAPTTFHGALHRNTNSRFGVQDEFHAIIRPVSDLTAGFHTYAALWTPTVVVWYLDGVELGRSPVFDSTDQDMFLILDMWIDGAVPPDASTPDELRLEVDEVSVWQAPVVGRRSGA